MELMLREHQMHVIEELREGFRKGHRTQLLYAPTGFGKTEVAIYLMKATREKFKRAAMVLDRLVLVDEISVPAPKTKELVSKLEGLGVSNVLIVTEAVDENSNEVRLLHGFPSENDLFCAGLPRPAPERTLRK